MAADIVRTTADDAADALRHLAAVERELVNLRAHLLPLLGEDPAEGAVHAARRSARIVAGETALAARLVTDAARRPARAPVPG